MKPVDVFRLGMRRALSQIDAWLKRDFLAEKYPSEPDLRAMSDGVKLAHQYIFGLLGRDVSTDDITVTTVRSIDPADALARPRVHVEVLLRLRYQPGEFNDQEAVVLDSAIRAVQDVLAKDRLVPTGTPREETHDERCDHRAP